MEKHKIPHLTVVCSYFYPKVGGLETIAFTTAKMLQKNGKYTVSVITSNYDGKGYRKENIEGLTVHRLPILFKISNTPIHPLWSSWVKKIFKEEQPDIVHTHSPVPYLADVAAGVASRAGIPVVATYHAGSMRKGRQPVDTLIYIYEHFFLFKLFKRAKAIVAVSQSFAKREFPQFRDKTYFIPTGVDLARFKKTPLPEKDTVTFIGRIEHSSSWKGIEQLLQAMKLVIEKRPETKLELVGGGDALEHYRQRAKELGIADGVSLVGPQHGDALIQAYQRATLTVLPSTSDSEAFSVALIEAMASGRPVVGTNIGGTPQVIHHEKDGLLVEPADPLALAEGILRILEDRSFAQRLGDAGADNAKNFAWEIQVAKYVELFEKP